MGKPPNGRKHVHADREGKRVDSTRENDPLSETSARELEDRLLRLENAHSTGNSDVYKFAFFFVMGVVLTVLIYPRVSSTFDTKSLQSMNNVQAKKAESSFDIEQIDELEELPEEHVPVVEDRKEHNRSKLFVKREDYKQDGKEDAIQRDDRKLNKREVKNVKTNVKEEKKYSNDKEHVEVETGQDDGTDDIEDEGEPVILKQEKIEDLMEDEVVEDKAEPISFSSNNDDTQRLNINIEDEEEPRTVELFKANADDLIRELPIEIKQDDVDNEDPISKRKPNKKVNKSKKSSQTKPKDKENKDTKNKETASKTETNENIPKEIKDFKPTYQKTVTPKKVFIDGRRIPPMELLPQKPNNSSVKIWLFEEFLSEEECDGLMRVHNKHVEDQSKDDPILCFDSVSTLRKHLKSAGKRMLVTPNVFTKGTTCVNASFSSQLKEWFKGNWSYSTAFYPGESRFAMAFEQRVKQAMGLNPENGGKFQITSYPEGIGYKSHTDCVENSEDKRDRMATVLVYLDTVTEGGETDFPELGVWARPRKGRALLWNNMNPAGDCEPMSIHKANKVIDGHKFILQRWYYYKSFYSLGKRPPEPPLPKRKDGQPRVSCDEYEHGSCRWYDEWNFEHMIEYERQKYTLV